MVSEHHDFYKLLMALKVLVPNQMVGTMAIEQDSRTVTHGKQCQMRGFLQQLSKNQKQVKVVFIFLLNFQTQIVTTVYYQKSPKTVPINTSQLKMSKHCQVTEQTLNELHSLYADSRHILIHNHSHKSIPSKKNSLQLPQINNLT